MISIKINHSLRELNIELISDEIELLKSGGALFYAKYLKCNSRETAVYVYYIFKDKYQSKERDELINNWVMKNLINRDTLQILCENASSPDEIKIMSEKIMSACYFRKYLDLFINKNSLDIIDYTDDKLSNQIIAVAKFIKNEITCRSIPKARDISKKDIFIGMLLTLIIVNYLLQTTKINFEILSALICIMIYPELDIGKTSKILGTVIPAYNLICEKKRNDIFDPIQMEVDNFFKTNDSKYLDNLSAIFVELSEHIHQNKDI